MKLHFNGRWLEKEALVDSNAKTNFIYPKLFKNIIVRKLEPVSTMEILFKKLQKLLKCCNIFFNAIDNLQTIKHQMSNFIIMDIGDLDIILKIL